MKDRLRIALAQLDFLVGAVEANTDRILAAAAEARDRLQADLVIFPELALTGYPPEDLLLRPGLYLHVMRALERIRREVRGIHVLVGHPEETVHGRFNAATLFRDGEVVAVCRKQHLPNYSVFDEKRYFVPGEAGCVAEVGGARVGLTICEDVWHPGPAQAAAARGAQLLLNINASPFHEDKLAEREAVVADRVRETGLPVVYLNLVGGQDELVFDGASFVMDGEGRVRARLPFCAEAMSVVEFARREGRVVPVPQEAPAEVPAPLESIRRVLVLGIRDYVHKNRFPGAVLGLSGGIDSSLTLALAVEALGAEAVEAVMMPSRYTADISREDAALEAGRLGVTYRVLPIEKPFSAFLDVLSGEFAGRAPDVTEENIQARCRGVLLMALSNKTGRIVLTTGNKSEMAVGYATLYGDMAGGFAPIKDLFKTRVYALAEHLNRSCGEIIPRRVLERPPTAELAPGQTDQDTLPPYEVLDAILARYVERDLSIGEIIAEGFDEATVRRVVWMVDRNEYKRRQAPPGIRISRRAFGRDRRYPITSGYLDTQLADHIDV
ncbi:MAG: NAD+ synthase [Gammaproteobacteria bacterium]|nr:MAG: NAD+ synthase [Gammaproteobacteria bacterium]